MRKPVKSLIATVGAAGLLSAGFAAPAVAAPANPDGSSTNVRTTDFVHTTDLTVTVDGTDARREDSPWSCGKFRLDGWANGRAGATTGAWRVAVGASYDIPPSLIFVTTAGSGWTIDEFTTFNGYGSADSEASAADTTATSTHPAYTFVSDIENRVSVDYSTRYVTIGLTEGLRAGEYFNLEFPTSIAPTAESGTQLMNSAQIVASCEVPDPPKPPVKQVNAGGIESGASGIAAIALGAAAIGGLAAYGRKRAQR